MCYMNAKQPLQCILVMRPGRQTRALRSPWLPVIHTASVRFDRGMLYLRASSRVNIAVLRVVAEGLNGPSQ